MDEIKKETHLTSHVSHSHSTTLENMTEEFRKTDGFMETELRRYRERITRAF